MPYYGHPDGFVNLIMRFDPFELYSPVSQLIGDLSFLVIWGSISRRFNTAKKTYNKIGSAGCQFSCHSNGFG
jgi:hypothetical protein